MAASARGGQIRAVFWTGSLTLFLLWLLALLLGARGGWTLALPIAVALLLAYRLGAARFRE